jgi:hypothetical protein
MSDPEHLAYSSVDPEYRLVELGMEIITEDAMILGRIISIEPSSHRGSPNIFFVNTIHPLLNLFSSVYQISASDIATVGHHRIILAKDALNRIVKIKSGLLESSGLFNSLHTKIENKKISWKQATLVSKKSIDPYSGDRSTIWDEDLSEDDLWDEDNWRDRPDDEPPYSRVTVPKKPNPNLPPLVMVVDKDGNDR